MIWLSARQRCWGVFRFCWQTTTIVLIYFLLKGADRTEFIFPPSQFTMQLFPEWALCALCLALQTQTKRRKGKSNEVKYRIIAIDPIGSPRQTMTQAMYN